MNWRNIHIQSPYSSSSSIRQHQKRYTPIRRQNSNIESQKSQTQLPLQNSNSNSQIHSKSLERENSSKEKVFTYNIKKERKEHGHPGSRVKKYVVTQDWVIKLKTEVNRIMKCTRELCALTKSNMAHLDKMFKAEMEKARQDLMTKVQDIVQMLEKNHPETTATGKPKAIIQDDRKQLGSQVSLVMQLEQKLEEVQCTTAVHNPESKLLLKPSILKQSFNLNMSCNEDNMIGSGEKVQKRETPKDLPQSQKMTEIKIRVGKEIIEQNFAQDKNNTSKKIPQLKKSLSNSIQQMKIDLKNSRNLKRKGPNGKESRNGEGNTETARKPSFRSSKEEGKPEEVTDLGLKFQNCNRKFLNPENKSMTQRHPPMVRNGRKQKCLEETDNAGTRKPQIGQTMLNMNHCIDKMKRMLDNLG